MSEGSARRILCRNCGKAELKEGEVCSACGVAMPIGVEDPDRNSLPANMRNLLRLNGVDPFQSLRSTHRHLRSNRTYRYL